MTKKAKEVSCAILGHVPGWLPNDDPVWVSRRGCKRCGIGMNGQDFPVPGPNMSTVVRRSVPLPRPVGRFEKLTND